MDQNPIIRLGDFSGGLRNRYASPLNSAPNSLSEGKNITLQNRILETRPGYEVYSTGSLPVGTVRYLEQVRFPTNEQAFLIAQMQMDQREGGVERSKHNVDYYNGKLYIWGGLSTVMDIYDIASGVWSTGTSGGTARAYAGSAYYNGNIYYWGGYNSQSQDINTIDIYNISGDSWSTGTAGGTARSGAVAEAYNGNIYFISVNIVDIYSISGDSWSTGTAGGGDRWGSGSALVGDKIYVWAGQGEGYYNWLRCYDITGNSWSTLTSGGTARAFPTMTHYNGSLYGWGGWVGAGAPLNTMYAYSISGNSWSSGVDGGIGRKYHEAAYDGSRYWYQHGGIDSSDNDINELDIFDFATMTWITGSYGELYAALDDGSPSFEKIYDLGASPGVVSCAVLNDVAVITEGIEKQPLWWAGCLDESGATDWTNPLAVWISQDGENWFDISTEVLDKDDDQYAILVNGVGSAGGLLIKNPVPWVKGYYIQFQTPNTEEGNQTTGSTSLALNDMTDITQPDLKGEIVYWKQDSGATGHFEGTTKLIDNAAAVDKGGGLVGIPMISQPYATADQIEIRLTTNYDGTYAVDATSSANEIVISHAFSAETFDGDETVNQRLTLDAGNDCPDVEQGVMIYYSGGSKILVTISDDGEANGEVTLSDTLTDQTVTAIYGIYIDSNGARPGVDWDGVNTQTVTLTGTTVSYGQSGYPLGTISLRNIINKSGQVTASGDQVRFKLKSAPYIPFTSIGMNVQNVSIVERSGSTANGTASPTEITVSAAAKEALKYGDGEEWTEWTDFSFDHTKNHLFIIDLNYVTYVTGNPSKYHAVSGISSIMGGSYFKKSDASYNDQNVTGYDTTFSDSNYYGVQFGFSEYQVRTRGTYPTTPFVGYTSFLDLANNYSVTGITVDGDEPTGSYIYVAVSFDGLNTFQVYLDSAWHDIVQYSDPNWQYYDGSSWQNATTNTLLGALEEAFADTDNQMTITELEALTVDELTDTAAFVSGATTSLSVAFCMISGGTEATIPKITGTAVSGVIYGATTVLVHKDGDWEAETWSDGTEVAQVSFAQDGIIQTTEDYATLDYHVESGEPGYYVKLQFAEGLTAGTAITRIQMSAPCQPLANIGLGWDTTPLGFLYVDDSVDSVKDFTTKVSDYTDTDDSTAWICDDITDPDTAVPMQIADSILIGDVGLFNQVQLSIHKVYNNMTDSVMSAYYWNGEEWYPLTITDGTDVDGVTLAKKGTISFSVPSDWVQHSPYSAFVRGYWIKLMVSVVIDVVGITECRLQPVPNALVKHKYAATWRNRIVMASRPDATDQVDFTRELEEYGWSGGDVFDQRVGGQDNIVALFSAFDRCFIVKPKDWFMASSSSGSISIARLASITEAPVNNRCLVHAPAGPLGQGASPGLFFLGLNGAYLVTGIQSDLEWGTGQVQKISDSVNWWQPDPTVRLDLDYLYLSYGMYSSKHHCIFWSVPMITDGSTPQTTPNYLLVYDIGLGCWYTPWDLAFSALCSGFETNSNAPGKLGQPVLYAGDSAGRVLKLFEATTDNTSEIDAYAVTGLLTPGTEIQWQFEGIFIVGKTASADDELDMSIFLDGEATASIDVLFSKAGDDTYSTYEAVNDFAGAQDGALARFFKYRIDMSGPSKIFGIDTKLWSDIEDPDTG